MTSARITWEYLVLAFCEKGSFYGNLKENELQANIATWLICFRLHQPDLILVTTLNRLINKRFNAFTHSAYFPVVVILADKVYHRRRPVYENSKWARLRERVGCIYARVLRSQSQDLFI